jgi:hypothetical protein
MGDRVEGDNVVQPGAGPPMHVHHYQEEVFTVEHGRLCYQRRGEPARFAGPGETVVFPAGQPHRFWNAGDAELRCSAHVEPADNVEFFLTEIFASAQRGGRGRPGLFDSAFLLTRYRSEYEMLEIPAVVQRVVFPVLLAIGTLLGTYRKYADAPEPIRR